MSNIARISSNTNQAAKGSLPNAQRPPSIAIWRAVDNPELADALETDFGQLRGLVIDDRTLLDVMADKEAWKKQKASLSCYSLVTLRQGETRRETANVTWVHAISLDFDKGAPDWTSL